MEKDIKPQNIQFHCRTCLNQFLNDVKFDIGELPRSMFQLLKQSINYRKTSKSALYPEHICQQCHDLIRNYDEFQETAKKSAEFLEEILKPYAADAETLEDEEASKGEDEAEYNLAASEDGRSNSNDDPLQSSPTALPVKIEFDEIEHSMDLSMSAEFESEVEEEAEQNTELSVEFKTEEDTVAADKPKQEYKCDICDKILSSKASLYMHKRTHKTENPFKCHVCERGFVKRFRLTSHLKNIHGITTPSTPSTKGRKKKDAAGANDEQINDSSVNENEADDDNSELIKIKIEKINDKMNEIIASQDFANLDRMCTICHKTFATTTGLRGHMRTHDETPRFSCDKCGRGFHKKARFNLHMAEFHGEQPLEFPCKYGCGKTFKHAESAAGHYRVKHVLPSKNETPKDYTRICEICGKICKNISVLKEHHWQHVPLEETPYQCKTCKKRFRTKKHLINHEQRHAGIKKFECPQCGLKKMSPHELRVHMNYHTKAIQHYCSICNKAFTNPGNMRRHEQVVHQGIKKFNCRFCEESFGKAETLKHHEMRHTGERPHKCPHCERSFIQSVALKTHLKTHNKLPKFPVDRKVGLLDMQATTQTTQPQPQQPPPIMAESAAAFVESQKLTALLDATSVVSKLPGFHETQKLAHLNMPDPNVMLHDPANTAGLNKLAADYSDTQKLSGLNMHQDGNL